MLDTELAAWLAPAPVALRCLIFIDSLDGLTVISGSAVVSGWKTTLFLGLSSNSDKSDSLQVAMRTDHNV